MRPEDFVESRDRGFTRLWMVAPEYRIVDHHVCPLVDGKLIHPGPGDNRGMRNYMPMARPELPAELAKVSTEREVLTFVERYGLLGYTQAWRLEEAAGMATLYSGGEQAKQPSAPGDPVGWVIAHAQTVKLLLDLIGSLDKEAALREQIESLTVERTQSGGTHISNVIVTRVARRGYLRPSQMEMRPTPPREAALWIISHVLDRNLTGVSRELVVEYHDDGQRGFTSLFTFCNLMDCVYWHLADAVVGGWVRRCAYPRCGAFFVAKSKRTKYCPPPIGNQSVSPCMNRHKQQSYRDRHRENGRDEPGARSKKKGKKKGAR